MEPYRNPPLYVDNTAFLSVGYGSFRIKHFGKGIMKIRTRPLPRPYFQGYLLWC